MKAPIQTRAQLLEANRKLLARVGQLEAALGLRAAGGAAPGKPEGNGRARPAVAIAQGGGAAPAVAPARQEADGAPGSSTPVAPDAHGAARTSGGPLPGRHGGNRLEEALRTSPALLQTIFDTLPIGVQVKGADHRYVLVNQALARFFGRRPEQILHRTFAELGVGTAEERAAIEAMDRRVLETGERIEISEKPLNIPGGGKFWRRGVKAPLCDDAGEVVGLVGVMVDITGPVGTEQRLRESERLFQAVLDNVPHAIFVKDLEGRYLMANKSKGELHAMKVANLIGTRLSDLPGGNSSEVETLEATDRQVLATRQPVEHLAQPFTGTDGKQRWRHILKLPYQDEAGTLIGLVGVSQDISERRQIEAQLRHLQKMEAIGTMAGGIAHDFNNILFPILGFTELTLESLPPGSEEHEQLGIVRNAALRARDIVAQLLQFASQAETQPRRVFLHILVKEALRLLRSTLPTTIRLEERASSEAAPVFGDVSQLHQALVNLCVNAGHAMQEGGVLTVSVENVELKDFRCAFGKVRNGPHVRLAVTDTGAGMDEETLAHIFDPFYTTRPVGMGSGLGLSAVLGIIDQHEGGLKVITRPGGGSTFEIYLEAMQEQEPPAAAAPTAESGTILLVDDEEAVTALGKRLLEDFGYTVWAFNSSREALAAFAADPAAFDLVISDVTMPELDGDGLSRELRRIREDIPIIFGSGYDKEDVAGTRDLPTLDGFFRKPITRSELGTVVRDVLERHRAGAPS